MSLENYIYPPRPEHKISNDRLYHFEKTNDYIAQPKINGSCCIIIINRGKINFYNRHKETFSSFKFPIQEILSNLNTEKLTILVGEYLNKSQADEKNEINNHRIILFDILTFQDQNLIGKTFLERQSLLRSIFQIHNYNKWIDRITDHLFIVKNFENDFLNIFNDITQHQIYEGLVLKKKNAKLGSGFVKNNNTNWQMKCRKATKNYKF